VLCKIRRKKMDKKMYMSPELEIIELEVYAALMAGSDADSDTTDPVDKVTDPTDDDFNW
jgi:hypothetical protein